MIKRKGSRELTGTYRGSFGRCTLERTTRFKDISSGGFTRSRVTFCLLIHIQLTIFENNMWPCREYNISYTRYRYKREEIHEQRGVETRDKMAKRRERVMNCQKKGLIRAGRRKS